MVARGTDFVRDGAVVVTGWIVGNASRAILDDRVVDPVAYDAIYLARDMSVVRECKRVEWFRYCWRWLNSWHPIDQLLLFFVVTFCAVAKQAVGYWF